MKFCGIVVQVNKNRFTDFRFDVTLSRWRLWRHFTQQRACHLVSEHKASAGA